MARKNKVTLQFLANKLSLSSHTVSKALRGLPGMSEETRLAILQEAERHGYRTRDQLWQQIWEGRDRASSKSRRFMFVTGLNAVQNSLKIRILEESVRERLEQMGNRLETVEFPTRSVLTKELAERMLEQKELAYVDGLFLSFGLPEVWEQSILRLPVAKMFLNFPPVGAETDSVVWDVYDAVQQSLLLLASRKHRRILYIGDRTTHRGYRLRWMAFQEFAGQYDLELHPDEHMTACYDSNEAFFHAFREKWTALRPTAFLCGIESDLERLLESCRKLGIRIPQDCSLVCLDTTENERVQDIANPGILVRETGHRAADRMLWRIANANMPYEHIRIHGKFCSGTTVHYANGTD
jgi:LacI family transcriptional regulator